MNVNEYKNIINGISEDALNQFKDKLLNFKKVIILGNGGSNAISSHIAEDYAKNLKLQTFSFTDAARLTCYINDYGMENAFVEFIKDYYDSETLVILISSSGNSDNIVNAALHCINNNFHLVTLTGFESENKVNTLVEKYGNALSFYVPSTDYGVVELTHELILHSVV
jgi:D-sedoheptulose 7-phosphate isomerase